MHRLLNRLSFPFKLILIGLLPVGFLVYLMAELNSEKSVKISLLSNFRGQLEQSYLLNNIIDRLQVERRYASGLISRTGYRTEFTLARSRTDEALQQLERSGFDRLSNFLDNSGLNHLSYIRAAAEEKKIDYEDVLSYYTNVILRINSLNTVSGANIPSLTQVNPNIRSQRILSQMISYLGLIRAGIHQRLAQQGSERSEKISTLRNDYRYFLSLEKEFLQKSTPSIVASYIRVKKSREMTAMLEFIELSNRAGIIPQSYRADEWWDLSTRAVDELRLLQKNVLDSVVKQTAFIHNEEVERQQRYNIIMIGMIVLVILIIYITIRNLTTLLNSINTVAGNLALGITGNSLDIRSGDVIGNLSDSILYIDTTNVELASAARLIGQGDFETELVPRSEQDVLGNALLTMKNNLQRFTSENADKMWTQEGLTIINDQVRGDKPVNEIARDALNALVKYVDAHTAAFYSSHDHTLNLVAGYAIDGVNVRKTIRAGEGLAGEAAASGRVRVVNDVPERYLDITSGTGLTTPKSLVIVPLMYYDENEGVIEMGSLHQFTSREIEFLKSAAHVIAVALQSARNRRRMQELLEETQSQSEELQSQHSELENLNAELEMQTEKLQASEEELRVQQEELQQINRELQERSHMLEDKNREIIKKSAELEQSTRYKSEFLANVSHELRTPLNSILLLSRLLHENNEKNLSEEQMEYARVIQASGNGLLALIDEILDLSKIEAGKMSLEMMDVPFSALQEDLDSLFRPQMREKNIGFGIQISEKLPESFVADKVRTEQILKNLISNALKFTSEGSVNVEITPEDEGMVAFTVHDTGIGIPQDKQDVIFEAFQQADGSTRRKYGGTGLGLSISRELARLMGGSITLKSAPGEGSAFTLHLPLRKTEFGKNADGRDPEAGGLAESPPANSEERDPFVAENIPENISDDRESIAPGDKCLLIVEDDAPFAKSLLEYGRKQGFRGIVCVRGDEAVSLAEQYRPKGILLDIQLPVQSGWQVMDQLKSNPVTKHIPVHMMSSYQLKRESLSRGAIDFMSKPVSPEQIRDAFEKIEKVFNRKPGRVVIFEEDPRRARAISEFLQSFDISTSTAHNTAEVFSMTDPENGDCLLIDLSIQGTRGSVILDELSKKPRLAETPVIVFTGKNVSAAEEKRLKQYDNAIIVKTVTSYQRMLDEVSIFLHLVEERSHDSRQRSVGSMTQVLAGKSVLVADDDVRNIFSLTRALENYQMHVITAENGREALDALNAHPEVNAVLLDMMMPEMDGYETASEIRRNPKWKDLPVIAVTAKTMTGDREKCIEAGASDYISKPVDVDQLISLLRVWLY